MEAQRLASRLVGQLVPSQPLQVFQRFHGPQVSRLGLHYATGRSDFDGLHSGKFNDEVQFYAFDILAAEGDDLRKLPLSMRKANLARLLARRADGIHVAPFEQGEIGPDLFRHACLMGLEGLVSKHRDSLYRGGRSDRGSR